MRKNRSSKYWAERAAALEAEIQADAGAAAERIKRIYESAIQNINADIETVFKNFARHLGIDEAQARELIEAAESDRELAELKLLLETASDAAEEDELIQRINAQAYGARMSRLEAVKTNIYIELRKAAQAERILHTVLSSKVIQKAYYTTIHDTAQGLNCGVSFSLIPKRAIEQLQKAQWHGSNYSSRVWKNNTQFISQVQKTIEDGVTAGHSIDRMARQLRDFVNEDSGKSPTYVTERLVRTETAHFMAEGQAAAYEEIGMETYRFIAALSERTCDVCAGLDGNVYRMAERVPGANYPPIHPNCRCITINGDFIPNTRVARNPPNGRNYKVDGSMTYQQWKDSLTDEQRSAMELHVKQMRNKSADTKQYERYKTVLGAENMPKTFDKWQELKYNNSERYSALKEWYQYERHPHLQSRLDYTKYNQEKVFIPSGASITSVKTIAGAGSNTTLRVEPGLVERYGGQIGEWKKRVGKVESSKYVIDVHWYELKGKQYRTKVKHWGDKK